MKKIVLALLMIFALISAHAAETLQSPDGKYHFVFEQKDGRLIYHLNYADKQVVEKGELGVNIDNHLVEAAMGIPMDTNRVWTTGMEVIKVERTAKDDTWKPAYGEYATIRAHYNEMTIHLMKGGTHGNSNDNGYDKRQQYLFDIIVRAYDEGVAFRYHFPEATNGLFMNITEDLTSFQLAPGAEAYHLHGHKLLLRK